MQEYDVVIIGGGQSGLSVGYYLRRSGLSFVILDQEEKPGGAWQHFWKSLRLFSPAQWSSLPGVIMDGGPDYYPTRDETVEYLHDYEIKYELPVRRPVEVVSVVKDTNRFIISTSKDTYNAKVLVSATGSFRNPFIPEIPGIKTFRGEILHSSQYQAPEIFKNKKVAVVGEGNSGGQILAELSSHTNTLWITSKEPRFLPDHVDGRYLFDAATQMYEAKKQGKLYQPPSLGDIVMVPSVKEARNRGVFSHSRRPFSELLEDRLRWPDGLEEKVDCIIFCTGFKSSLNHLSGLDVITKEGRVDTEETKAKAIDGLWLVGYGNWTGFASATLIGVGRSARQTVEEIKAYVSGS